MNCVIIMTSNVGARNITEKRSNRGFNSGEVDPETADYEQLKSLVNDDLKRTFKPEFLNRIDEIVVFHRLTKEDIRKISENMLASVENRMKEVDIYISADEKALDLVSEKGFDPVYGARPLRRTIQNMIEDTVAEKMLDGTITAGDHIKITAEDGKIEVLKEETDIAVQNTVK